MEDARAAIKSSSVHAHVLTHMCMLHVHVGGETPGTPVSAFIHAQEPKLRFWYSGSDSGYGSGFRLPSRLDRILVPFRRMPLQTRTRTTRTRTRTFRCCSSYMFSCMCMYV